MKQFSAETKAIIETHKNDFNNRNYKQKLKEFGGYKKYIRSLGGVFKKYANGNAHVTTIEQFQEVAEYVWGLMSIYGFDYNNGISYYRWGGGNPFYINGSKGKCNSGRIDMLCKEKDKTTCCNFGINSFLYKAGLLPKGKIKSCLTYVKTGGINIKHKKDLQVGDIIHFFTYQIDKNNPATWRGWHHVVIVGQITDDDIIVYDAGSKFIKSGKYKHSLSEYKNEKGWIAKRFWTLK